MSYEPYSKNTIIQESLTDLQQGIDTYEETNSSLQNNKIYLYSQDVRNKKPNVQDVSINDEKQLVINEYLVFTLGILAASSVFVFHIFNK
tara:strand:- start:673 stop:942 length:270 start_codon:yes stop_codon:yes gene_type:complete